MIIRTNSIYMINGWFIFNVFYKCFCNKSMYKIMLLVYHGFKITFAFIF